MSISANNKRNVITMKKTTYDKLEKLAESEKRSVNNLMNVIIEKYLEEYFQNNQ
jgi:predicted DNA-binding protein